jgi:26S proteasome non-ATPase regulatory subunit 9
MSTPLTTPDGFPRADLDVAQIRTTRTRIIYLKNDYKALMSEIEKAVHEHFANGIPLPVSASSSTDGTSLVPDRSIHARPTAPLEPVFAKVNNVAENSPGADAGLKVADEIRLFGYVNAENHNGLRRVGECVQGNEGHEILVKVSRPGLAGARQELTLRLTPRRDWGGRGLLGTHIVPL